MVAIRNADTSGSFFAAVASQPTPDDLITSQLDPSQPQVQGLTPVTDPLVPDQRVLTRLGNFDPELYDLTEDSHLVRLLKALLGAAGIGGLRRQLMLSRMSSTSISGSHFLDLDGFWGELFNLSRTVAEQMPVLADGTVFNPSTGVATSDVWDAVSSRDGRYRSRINALARSFNLGATYAGVMEAAEAVLGDEVEVSEAWSFADLVPPGSTQSTVNANTYLVVKSQYHTYGSMRGVQWGTLQGGMDVPGDTPLGNRGEVTITPKREITEEERRQVTLVLDALRPSGVLLTVLSTPIVTFQQVQPRTVRADSNDWQVVSSISEFQGLVGVAGTTVYPNQSAYEAARPAFSRYSGEKWAYNSRIAAVSSYEMVGDEVTNTNSDFQTVTYLDGTSYGYDPLQAILDPKQVILGRLAAEGVLTTYPYAPARTA